MPRNLSKTHMRVAITSEYETLFRQHFRLAVLYAEQIIGSAHEAEDIVQEVFIRLLNVDLSAIRQKEKYLYRCVHNEAVDHAQAQKRRRCYGMDSKEAALLTTDNDPFEETSDTHEQVEQLYRRIEALPEQGRRIFKMICLEQKSYEETADLLAVSLHTVKTHMARSFKKLRKKVRLLCSLI